MGGVAKITISPKSEFYYFLSPFWGSFWNQNFLKWRLASPWAALGSHLDRFWGVRKFVLNKFYGTGRYRTQTDGTGPDLKSSRMAKSIYPVSHMIRSSWLFAPSPNHQMSLLLPRVYFIEDVSRDLFCEDLGQFKSLWESILASIWRKTRSVLKSRFSTAFWIVFCAFWGALGTISVSLGTKTW